VKPTSQQIQLLKCIKKATSTKNEKYDIQVSDNDSYYTNQSKTNVRIMSFMIYMITHKHAN
jgi:hypothetical protein